MSERIRDLRTQEARARRLAGEQPQRDTHDTLEHYAEELGARADRLERQMMAGREGMPLHAASDHQMRDAHDRRANDEDEDDGYASSAASD